jgi:Tfp pilus assembly protein PilO
VRIQLRPTKKVLMALGGLAVLIVGLSVVAFRAQAAQRTAKLAELKAKQEEMARVVAEANALEESQAQLAELRYKMSFLRGAEPNDYQPALLVEMDALAKHSRVKLATFSPTEPPSNQKSPVATLSTARVAPHQFQQISGGMEGSYHDLTRFLYRLTGLPKIVSIDSMQIQAAPQGSPDRVRATFQMTAYVVKEIVPQTAAAAVKLQEIAAAETKYQAETQGFTDLASLNAKGLIALKEGEEYQGYVFTTEAKDTAKDKYKFLATPKDTKLRKLSIDQSLKILMHKDDNTTEPYE